MKDSFYPALARLAAPIVAQELITSSLNFIAVVLIGQLGEASVAAVGLANQIFFLLILMLFGVSSGSAIFAAQFWGQRDVAGLRKVLGLNLAMGMSGALLFTLGAVFFPEQLLGLYTRDPQVIALGSQYLRIVGLSYGLTAVTSSFTAAQRSCGNVRLPLVISVSALSISTLLGYGLIFGRFGLPALGVPGAAVATCTARLLECAAMVSLTYLLKTPPAARLREMLAFDLAFFKRFIRTTLTVAVNEVIWSLGITTYNAIYAHISTEAIAAVNIVTTVENLAIVVFIGLSNACAILVGNQIGAGEEETAFDYARRCLWLGVAGAVLLGAAMFASSSLMLTFYQISPQAYRYAQGLFAVLSAVLWVKVSNMLLFVGILRSGGDTRFAFLLDTASIWLIGVPMAYTGAFILHLPVYLVVLMGMAEEFFKFGVVLARFFSRRWIHNLVRHTAPSS